MRAEAMIAELKSFKRDWQRWSSSERMAARTLVLLGTALTLQAVWALLG